MAWFLRDSNNDFFGDPERSGFTALETLQPLSLPAGCESFEGIGNVLDQVETNGGGCEGTSTDSVLLAPPEGLHVEAEHSVVVPSVARPSSPIGVRSHELRQGENTRTSAASASSTVNVKRARRSAIEKRSRQQRSNVLHRMRREATRLEYIYQQARERHSAVRSEAAKAHYTADVASASEKSRVIYAAESDSTVLLMEKKYWRLKLMEKSLRQDQSLLWELTLKHEGFRRMLSAFTHQRDDPSCVTPGSGDDNNQEWSKAAIYNSGVRVSSSWQARPKQLTIPQCVVFVHNTYNNVCRFSKSDVFATTGASFMGWSGKRMFDAGSGELRYSFTKKFPLETHAKKLSTRVWERVMCGTGYTQSKFLSAGVLRFQTLQSIGDDLQVIRLDHTRPGSAKTFISLHMDFQMETPTGFVHVTRSVPALEIKNALEPHEHLYDTLHWTHFNQLFDDDGHPAGTEVVVCGSLSDKRQMMSERWLFDIALSLLQWESSHISPLFLKCT